ncbi:TPA: methyltransferase domain-containing protein, partial [Candidatus Micrarchaeota archaeon]|nr:methyltransferase domain-containing protein [Candidatus Micrarchaeota archaeon]
MNITAFYNGAAAQYAKFRRPQKEFEAVDRFIPLTGRSILDTGCGDGVISRYMALKGKQVTAFDISAEMIRIAASMQVEGCSFLVEDMQHFQPDAGTMFDGAVFLYSLIHNTKEETVSILRRISQFFNPNGSVLFVALHSNGLNSDCVTSVTVPSQFSD